MKTLTRNGSSPVATSHANTNSFSLRLKTIRDTGHLFQNKLSRHVIGQKAMVVAVVAALLGDIKVCLVGKSGVGKTYAAETLLKLLGIKGQLVPLNPDVTCSDITGWMSFDHETRQKVYWPSPFVNGTHMVVLDELNRSSDKVQSSLLDILNGNRVIVDQTQYEVSDILTTIMTMNPPEDPGTRPIIDALADRIDFTLMVRTPPPDTMRQIITHNCAAQPVEQMDEFKPVQMEDPQTGQMTAMNSSIAEPLIYDIRQNIKNILQRHISLDVPQLASEIVNNFQSKEWATPATVRTGMSIVKMATVTALIEDGCLPQPRHVWNVAPGCLGMLKPIDWMTTDERLQLITQRVQQIRRQYS